MPDKPTYWIKVLPKYSDNDFTIKIKNSASAKTDQTWCTRAGTNEFMYTT